MARLGDQGPSPHQPALPDWTRLVLDQGCIVKPLHHHRQVADCSETQGTMPPTCKAKANQASTSSPVLRIPHTAGA